MNGKSPPQDLVLPPPASGEELPLFSALQRRHTERKISAAPLPAQLLGNLLWAGCGVNRLSGPFGLAGRTAPSASNSQEIDVYVARPEAAYHYDPAQHRLVVAAAEDLRGAAITPGQEGMWPTAPVQLIYVADLERLDHTPGLDEPRLHAPEMQKAYCYVDCGLIAGHAGLFAAASGLAAWFHNCDRPALHAGLHLRPMQRVLFAQSVGYPEAQAHGAMTA
jgi:hypothetical protein